jgi:hypothetical protein
MNTVMRTLGGALRGQIVVTLITDNTASSGLPTVTGFTLSFALESAFLVVAFAAALLVPNAARQAVSGGTDATPEPVGAGRSAPVKMNVS